MKDSAQLFGAPSPEASKFAIDMFNFEKRIAEITPDSEYMSNPVKINNKMKVWNSETSYIMKASFMYIIIIIINFTVWSILCCFDFLQWTKMIDFVIIFLARTYEFNKKQKCALCLYLLMIYSNQGKFSLRVNRIVFLFVAKEVARSLYKMKL